MEKKIRIDIVIPVYNEEKELGHNIKKLLDYSRKHLSAYDFSIIIADNASTDKTQSIGTELARLYKEIKYQRFSQKGRGRAVKQIWKESTAEIACYMDIDLSTDLSYLSSLVKACLTHDIAIGSRLLPKSKVIERSLKRELISRTYNFLIKFLFVVKFSDAQCGFKAINQKRVAPLLKIVKDNGWFFDTELLILAEKSGYSIFEQPVIWTDNPGSTVRVLPTIMGDLKGLARLLFTKPWTKIKQTK